MGLFDSNEEIIRKKLEKIGLDDLIKAPEREKKAVESIVNLVALGQSQSLLASEKGKLSAQMYYLESISMGNLLVFQKLDQLNKNIEKLINK